jgi:hypothetical protein
MQSHLSIPEERWISMVELPGETAAPKSSNYINTKKWEEKLN